jgi:hypothetical protein
MPRLNVTEFDIKGKITMNMINCWLKVWQTPQQPPIVIEFSDGVILNITDIVRKIKKDSNNALNVIMDDSRTVKFEPHESVVAFQLSENLAAMLGVVSGRLSESVFGVVDLFVHYRKCFLLCDQAPANCSINMSEFPAITPVSLHIEDTGVVVGSSIPGAFQQLNNLRSVQSLSRLTFRLVSAQSPHQAFPITAAAYSLTFQLIF